MDAAQLEEVRRTILSTLACLGMPKAQWSLVTDARSPRRQTEIDAESPATRIRVVWLLDQQLLEFYQYDGELLTRVPVANVNEETKAG